MTLADLHEAISRLLNDTGVDTGTYSLAQRTKAANWACLECSKILGLTEKESIVNLSALTPAAPAFDVTDLEILSMNRVEIKETV
jgi:hypothetical protein